MDIELPPDFREFLRLLHKHEVKYLLIGGYAVGYHGYPRSTNDLDVWVAVHPANAEHIVAVLKEFGFDTPDLSVNLFLKDWNIIRMGIEPVRLEITTSISGVDFDACYAERVIDTLDGVEVNIIDLRHLKLNKQASGRHKDLDDLEHLP
jgi:predicted nucleotidyltransferase